MPEDEHLFDAAQDAWRRVEQEGMLTNYFLIMEGVTADGRPRVDWLWSPGLMSWHLKGLLHEALDAQLSGETAATVNRDEDS